MRWAIITTGCLIFFLAGCSTKNPPVMDQRLGEFTLASTHIVNNLHFKQKDTIKFRVKGEACIEVDPETLEYISGPKDNRMQRAMDDAITKGNEQGFEGDILINVRIENKTLFLEGEKEWWQTSNLRRMECVEVSGELVSLER